MIFAIVNPADRVVALVCAHTARLRYTQTAVVSHPLNTISSCREKARGGKDGKGGAWCRGDSLIISITYANLGRETGFDAIQSNYFTLGKWLLLVVEARRVQREKTRSRGINDGA